jgi:drug/metabolite transporter (DMT)-like permease
VGGRATKREGEQTMHLGHIFLIISLLALGLIGILLKVADYLKCRGSAITGTMCMWAGMFLLTYLLLIHRAFLLLKTPGKLYMVAGLCGFCASLAIISFQAGLQHGKIATSWVIINLSTALPTILSILVYRETVSLAKAVALLLAVLAILFLWKDKQLDDTAQSAEIKASTVHENVHTRSRKGRAIWIRMMLMCFLANGLGAFGLRIMSGMGLSETYKLSYLVLWYWSGFLLAAVIFLAGRTIPNRREWAVGAGLALCSVVGQLGMAFALDYGIPGFVVFQVGPGGGLFVVVLVGILVFKERVSKCGTMGISLGVAALAVLSFA